MNTIGRRNVLAGIVAVGGAAAICTLPVPARSQEKSRLTITIGKRRIELIIPFFPEVPPKSETVTVQARVAGSGGRTYSMSFPAAQLNAIAEGSKDGRIAMSASAGKLRVNGRFALSQVGTAKGTLMAQRGDEEEETGDVQAMVVPAGAVAIVGIVAGAAVAMVGIVATVATVKILSQSGGGGTVEVQAETSAGDVNVSVAVGDKEK